MDDHDQLKFFLFLYTVLFFLASFTIQGKGVGAREKRIIRFVILNRMERRRRETRIFTARLRLKLFHMSWRTKVLDSDSGRFRVRFRVWQFERSRSVFGMLILNVNGVIFFLS